MLIGGRLMIAGFGLRHVCPILVPFVDRLYRVVAVRA